MQSLAGISVSFIFKRLLLWSDGSLAILGISSGILGVLLLGVAGFTAVKSTVITDQSQLLSHSPTNHNSSLTDQSQPLLLTDQSQLLSLTDQSQLLAHRLITTPRSPTNHNSSLTDQSQPLSCSPPNHVSPHSHQPIITLLTLINPLWLLYHSQTNRSSAKFCSLTNRDLSHLFSGVLCALVAESDCRSVPACRYN